MQGLDHLLHSIFLLPPHFLSIWLRCLLHSPSTNLILHDESSVRSHVLFFVFFCSREEPVPVSRFLERRLASFASSSSSSAVTAAAAGRHSCVTAHCTIHAPISFHAFFGFIHKTAANYMYCIGPSIDCSMFMVSIYRV